MVKESFGDTYYSKAMDCVKVLREEAIQVRKEGGREREGREKGRGRKREVEGRR